jgi:hypothetical protein
MRWKISIKLSIVLAITTGIACSTGSKQKEGEVVAPKPQDPTPVKAAKPKIESKELPKIILPPKPLFRPSHRVSAAAEMYIEGPQQARPPDGIIPADTEIQLVRDEGSYVRVRLKEGQEVSISRSVLSSLPRDDAYE